MLLVTDESLCTIGYFEKRRSSKRRGPSKVVNPKAKALHAPCSGGRHAYEKLV